MTQKNFELKEGNSYTFKVTGTIILPDGSDSFVLSDPNNVRHLLNARYYKGYEFRNNQKITCRIDKINCTGKIYLEPEHPHYKLGETYNFQFYAYVDVTNAAEEINKIAILTDILGNTVKISADEIIGPLKSGDIVPCKILTIRKGRVRLTNDISGNDYSGLVPGEVYSFSIVEELSLGDNYDFYIIENKEGRRFKLRRKFFKDYYFYFGKRIKAILNGSNGEYYLEPVHPKYEVGEIYDFEILKEGLINEYPNIKKKAYFLKNKHGKDIVIKKEDIDPLTISDNRISCRVIKIKHSQVYIECQ